MNSKNIEQAMLKDNFIKQKFIGVYPIDRIPLVLPPKSLTIVNLDPSDKKGSHWIVIHHITKGKIEHFDSLGNKPDKKIHNLLTANNMTYKYNNKRIQNFFTDTCGLYCIYYSYYSARGRSMEEILNDFSSNLNLNELIVKGFYCTHIIPKIND